jgi:hypothetical protein
VKNDENRPWESADLEFAIVPAGGLLAVVRTLVLVVGGTLAWMTPGFGPTDAALEPHAVMEAITRLA